MSIPRIIHMTTPTGQLTVNEQNVVDANLAYLNGYEVNIYSDIRNDEFMKVNYPEFYGWYSSIQKGVVKADIVRCLYVHKFGGIYMDTDLVLYNSLPDEWFDKILVLPSEGTVLVPHLDKTFPMVGNFFIAAEKGCKYLYDFIQSRVNNFELNECTPDNIFKAVGPHALITYYINMCVNNPSESANICVLDQDVLSPDVYIYNDRREVVSSVNTVGAHLCFGGWKSK